METNPTNHIYQVIRMATGNKVHLKENGSSQTECAVWTAYSRQYATDDTVITCTKCWRAANRTYRGQDAVKAQGLTREVK